MKSVLVAWTLQLLSNSHCCFRVAIIDQWGTSVTRMGNLSDWVLAESPENEPYKLVFLKRKEKKRKRNVLDWGCAVADTEAIADTIDSHLDALSTVKTTSIRQKQHLKHPSSGVHLTVGILDCHLLGIVWPSKWLWWERLVLCHEVRSSNDGHHFWSPRKRNR